MLSRVERKHCQDTYIMLGSVGRYLGLPTAPWRLTSSVQSLRKPDKASGIDQAINLSLSDIAGAVYLVAMVNRLLDLTVR